MAQLSADKVARLLEKAIEDKKKQGAEPAPRYVQPTKAEGDALDAAHGVPSVRKGEDPLSSRPFRLLTLLGQKLGKVSREYAKVELEAVGAVRKAMEDSGNTPTEFETDSFVLPFSTALLPDSLVGSREFRTAVEPIRKSLAASADPDEVRWLHNRVYKAPMSYLDDSVGGTLVAPPEQGEVLELMRPVPGCQRAGAKVVPLPPQGKRVYPREASASTGYWLTEATTIPESQVQTGQVSLMAKKAACAIVVNNELFKFTSGAADAILRNNMTRTLENTLDYAAFYGTGSGGQPKGLKLYTATNEVIVQTASVTGTDGDTMQPQDGYKLVGQIEDRNFEFTGWQMRAMAWATVSSVRAAAVTTTDALGPFVQDITRAIGASPGESYCGYKVTKNNLISNTITKASGTNLSEVWGGAWNQLFLGMYGAIELATSNQAGSSFLADQSILRGILHCDVVPAYPGAFGYVKELIIYPS